MDRHSEAQQGAGGWFKAVSESRYYQARRTARLAMGTFGPGLPQWIASMLLARAAHQTQYLPHVSIQAVCADLAKAAKRDNALNEIAREFPPFLPAAWHAAEDGLDGHRLQVAARLILAALHDPHASFELFSRIGLVSAVDEASMQERNDSQSMLLTTIRQLAATGSGRHLAPLPAAEAFQKLAMDMPNLAEVVDFYRGQSALLRLSDIATALFPPVLLLGPPGVGKTLFANRLAEMVGSPCRVISMANQSAGWVISGLDRSWGNAKPGTVFTTLAGSRQANPVILVDELDKASGDARYNVVGGLYGLLERDTALQFSDEYVGIPINASAVIWIITANEADFIPKPLLSRLTVFHVEPPDATQARRIVCSQFDRIKGSAPFEPLCDEVVNELAAVAPREIGIRLRVAVGRAAQRALDTGHIPASVQLDDVPGSLKPGQRRLGFL